jgi:hypothetical protein
MSLAEFLGLLANFATCVAAFIALFALWEVKKQRASTYQPDLAPIRRPFFYMAHNFDMSVMSRWVTDPPADFNWESFNPVGQSWKWGSKISPHRMGLAYRGGPCGCKPTLSSSQNSNEFRN